MKLVKIISLIFSIVFSFVLFVSGASAGVQYSNCRHPGTELVICWETINLYLKSKFEDEELQLLPFELPNQEIFSNADRSVLVQSLPASGYLLIDKVGNKFNMKCAPAKNGTCRPWR